MKWFFVMLFALIVSSPLYALNTAQQAFLDGGYYNNLISDDDFISINQLSESNIQSFLTQKGSFLKDYSEGSRSAARIIWDACHGNSPDSVGSLAGIVIDSTTGTVNPWVVLATLQKEQSLITSTTYNQSKLDYAMGYGCLESGAWNPAYKGFAKQIDWAAWQLRYNFHRSEPERTTLPNYKVGQMMTFSNAGYSNIAVTFENRATASLYRYTPHVFNGNYNFWKFYDTYSSQPVPEPSGLLVLGAGIATLTTLKRRRKG